MQFNYFQGLFTLVTQCMWYTMQHNSNLHITEFKENKENSFEKSSSRYFCKTSQEVGTEFYICVTIGILMSFPFKQSPQNHENSQRTLPIIFLKEISSPQRMLINMDALTGNLLRIFHFSMVIEINRSPINPPRLCGVHTYASVNWDLIGSDNVLSTVRHGTKPLSEPMLPSQQQTLRNGYVIITTFRRNNYVFNTHYVC